MCRSIIPTNIKDFFSESFILVGNDKDSDKEQLQFYLIQIIEFVTETLKMR